MSDNKNLSDYDKNNMDLNKLLPATNVEDAKVLEHFIHNLFNRFYTKEEVERIVGYIGSDENSTENIRKINEPTDYRQGNQLQPIVYSKVGDVDWFMSFTDLMNRLEFLGVNIDRFNEWGNSLQFNWVPPIDFDKLVNYQDYYWDTTLFDDPPQFITIKNQCNWVSARKTQVLKSTILTLPTYKIVGYDEPNNVVELNGDQTNNLRAGEMVVLAADSIDPIAVHTKTITYDSINDQTEIEFDSVDYDITIGVNDNFNTITNTETPVVTASDSENSISVRGNVTSIFTANYVFSTEGCNLSGPNCLWTVESSTFDSDENITTIFTKEDVPPAFFYGYVTVKPIILSTMSEYNVICNSPYSRPEFTSYSEDDFGDIIWAKNIKLLSSTSGSTTLGSSLFTDNSGTKDFLDGTYNVGDIVRIKGTGFDGDYPILNIVTTDILDLGFKVFTYNNINYEIIRKRVLTDIESDITPPLVVEDQYWFDTTNDQLRQWNGIEWQVLFNNYSKIVNTTFNAHLVDLSQNNDWVNENKWIHRTEVNNFTGKSRAQMPIIEYFPHIKLSQHSFSKKVWKYRRNEQVSYANVNVEPTLFELLDIKKSTSSSGEIAFQDDTTLVFDSKYGNLTEGLQPGSLINLGDFNSNNGIKTVKYSEFISLSPGTRHRTRVKLTDNVKDPFDVPIGAHVTPVTTSMGDPWVSYNMYHWQFQGIEDITPSSVEPKKNKMLDTIVGSSVNGTLSTILGLYFQEFKFISGSPAVNGYEFTLDNSLHDLTLYDDYEEGDIRVYINGERQYDNFIDIESTNDPNFVGGIKFSQTVQITDNDIIRIELGEYAEEDVGKRAVFVNTISGTRWVNLVNIRKIEQNKTERSQYPWFNVYDVHQNPLNIASNIFTYKDDPAGTYSPNINQRVIFDSVSQDYTFEQSLINPDTKELYLYHDGREYEDEFQSIWKKGINREQYVPVKRDGFWEIPNHLYYNVKHENKSTIKLTEIFRHFNSIINKQWSGGISADTYNNVYHLDGVVNYGLGGTIKEHNDGFDTLVSSMFVNNINPVDLIMFASSIYDNSQVTVKSMLESKIAFYFQNQDIGSVAELIDFAKADIKNEYEKNDKLDQWFGDSTTYDETTKEGVKNWIATIPYMGLKPKVKPYIINDLEYDILELVHHDGHRTDVKINQATLELFYNRLKQNNAINIAFQSITSSSTPYPLTIDGSPVSNGDLLLRTNTVLSSRKLYRYNTLGNWEQVDISLVFAESMLNIEMALYNNLTDNALPLNFVDKFNFNTIINDVEYDNLIQQQFSEFIKLKNIENPYNNSDYEQNDPFTWNYAYTNVKADPLYGRSKTNRFASWQAVYNNVYNTPYPNLEPWRLQGYDIKPDYWDSEYRDSTMSRIWKSTMWFNIINGVIPVGETAPNGMTGTGATGQIIETYSYIPVNIENTNTDDGYGPDEILPPYWNSNNASNPIIRTPFDAANKEFIVTPSATYEFGQLGPVEWEWNVSAQRLYDDLVVSFKLQPLKFLNQTFGPELIDVACLQVDSRVNKVASHENIEFHGDIDENDKVVKVNGLNQWYVHYNRFNGFDGISSEFRKMWKDWELPLTYQFGAFVDTQNFKISSDIIDITNRDYEIIFKKASGIRDLWVDGLNATLTSMPSRFAPEYYTGIDWTISITNTTPNGRPLKAFGVENYPVNVEGGSSTFKTFSFKLNGAEIEESFGYDLIQYSETLTPEKATSLNNGLTPYYASVLVDGSTTINIVVEGHDAQTFGELVGVINDQLGNSASAFIEEGNLVIASSTIGGQTSLVVSDGGLFATASSDYKGTTGNVFNLVSFNKIFYVDDDISQYFEENSKFTIVSSTNFNGSYTVTASSYDVNNNVTRIEVEESITITNTIIDGYMEPDDVVTLPDTWETGTGLSWSTNGILPSQFNDVDLYYMIKINDREFQLATTKANAVKGTAIIPTSSGTKQAYVGRIKNTFTAFSAREVLVYWKQHYVDPRITKSLATPITISGIQNIIDFINGYGGYLENGGVVYDDSNKDNKTGRKNDWQLETEKLIEFLFNSRKTSQQEKEEFEIEPNFSTDTFTSNEIITWNTGTRVTLSSTGVLPSEFENPIASTIPYYVIQGLTPGVLQLAASKAEANKGNALTFSDNGSGTISLRLTPDVSRFPKIKLNPHYKSVTIEHDTGIMSNVLSGGNLDTLTNQRVFDQNIENFSNDEIIVLRKDKKSTIELTETRKEKNNSSNYASRYIEGMHLFFDGYEHVLQLSDYTTVDGLIYDTFLGINTPRLFLEFDRQNNFTLRPNVGGNVLLDGKQVRNIESSINSLRQAYNTYNTVEGDKITDQVRKQLGYDGPFDYADDINITDKSQFLFHRGMIQKKGTNFAADAYTNQSGFEDIDVDEFWAYRVGTFGDAKEKIYPELNLFSRDVAKKELRLEFIEPLGSVSNSSFKGIELNDEDRWYEQPDQNEKLKPRDRFYINMSIVENIDNVVTSAAYFVIGADEYLQLSQPADAAYVNYLIPASTPAEYVELTEGIDYRFITNTLIKFLDSGGGILPSSRRINVATLSYNYDAQNPANIINRRSGKIENEVPIWNPRRQQYYSKAIFAVDYRKDTDPARYNNPIEGQPVTNHWNGGFKDKVWFDILSEGYLPYDDKNIETNFDVRMKKWGKLADWGEIKVYQWTESNVAPNEYDALAADQENSGLPLSERKTGRTRKVVYRNDGTTTAPVWIEERDTHYHFISEIVEATTYTNSGAPLNTNVDVYVDGVYDPNKTSFTSNVDFETYSASGTTIHVIDRATVPTQLQIDALLYKYDTPYSTASRVNPLTGDAEITYYFWVEDRLSPITIKGGAVGSTTLRNVKINLQEIPTPFMIPNNIVDLTATGFSDLFITNTPRTDDAQSYEFPFAYNQLIIKGLSDNIRTDNDYTLRFTRDFTLRDGLGKYNTSELQLKNKHEEWKLFREKQFTKIDKFLWNAITESLLGFEYDGGPLIRSAGVTPTPTISVTPTVTPTPTSGGLTPTPTVTASITPSVTPTSTPDVTPTLTPNVTPTATVTPSVTPSNSLAPSPTPSITPSNTPVASPTPSPTPSITPSNTPVASPQPSQAVVYSAVGGTIDSFFFEGEQEVASIVYNTDGTVEAQTQDTINNYTDVIGNWSSLAPNEGGNSSVWIFLTTTETNNELEVSGSNMNNWYALNSNVAWHFTNSAGVSGSTFRGTYTILMSLDNAQTIHDSATLTVKLDTI